MKPLHSLLKRQLRRFSEETIPLLERQPDFIRAINDVYWGFDDDRKMLEHSLELTSQELLEKNAELSRINVELEKRVAERTAELSQNEERFRGLFEHVPVSIWEEDFSAVRDYVETLRSAGVIDFSTYFDEHPEVVAESAARVKIVDVNRATLEMYQADSKAQLLADLSKVLGLESLGPFKKELLALIQGDLVFETELINYTLKGEKLSVFLRMTLAPGCEQTWSKVFVGISNVTERRKAEVALAAERDLLQALMDNIPDTIYFKDRASRFTRINRAQAKMLGVARPEDAIGKTDLDFQPLELAQGFYEEEQRILQSGEPLTNRIEFNPTPDGTPRWFSATKVPIKDETGEITGMVGVSRDITMSKQAEDALRRSEERFRLVSWATKDAVWDWDLQGNQIEWGAGLQKILHYPSEITHTDSTWWLEHIHPEDRGKVERSMNQALQYGMEFWSKEYRFQRADQTYANIMDRGYIIKDGTGKPYRVIGAMLDITERKQAEETIRHQNEMLSSLHYITLSLLRHRNLSQLLNALVEFSATFLDAPYAEIMLMEKGKLVVKAATQNQQHLIGRQLRRSDALLSWQAFDTHEPAVLDDYESWSGRQHVYDEFSLHAVADFPILNDEQRLGVLALGRNKADYPFSTDQIQFGRFFANLTALVLINFQLREALLEQSIRDPLTGIFNRRYMEETLKREVRRVTRQLHPLGIIMIDIDHFKHFNDTHGHSSGDELLQRLGKFLQAHIRGEDVACRYGGEEFILILPNTSLGTAYERAEYLRQEVKKLQVQNSGPSQYGITLSLGIAIYPEHGRTIENVLRAADSALYRAKQSGRDRSAVAEKEA